MTVESRADSNVAIDSKVDGDDSGGIVGDKSVAVCKARVGEFESRTVVGYGPVTKFKVL